jgi:HSP20 family protein
MPKQKKSFFEKLTGIQKFEEDDEEIQVTNNPSSPAETEEEDDFADEQEEMYEFPEDNGEDENDFYSDFEDDNEEYQEKEQEEYYQNQGEEKPKEKQKKVSAAEESSEEEQLGSEGQLTIDVYQNDKEIVIKSTIAGVKPEDLDVNINDEMVTIKGKRDQGEEVDPENYYYQECYWGPFSRTIILPVEIVTDKAEALMKNGILTIKLPKAETTKTRKLQVRGF